MRQIRALGKYLLTCLVLTSVEARAATPQADALQLAAIEPKSGVTTPGSRVTVYGSGFSGDAVVYIGGVQVRETNFISPSRLEVLTPYLRPGIYRIQLKSGGKTIRSEMSFAALPSPIDSEIDRAVALAESGQTATAVDILTAMSKAHTDYQVRAFVQYQIGEIYFAKGDWLRWSWVDIFLDSDKAGPAVQTSWRYRLWLDQTGYLLNLGTKPEYDLKLADWTVIHDITQDPEPRFYRGLVNARYGNLRQGKEDSDFILAQEPHRTSYRALAAYIAVLGGDKTQLRSFSAESITDARALSLLGEAAYLSGDAAGAQRWWMLAGKEYPLGAGLALLAGKKHLARGHQRIAASLLAECSIMAPNSKEANEARDLLAKLGGPGT